MPPNNAGELSAEIYGDIAAYIFSSNIVAPDPSMQPLAQATPQNRPEADRVPRADGRGGGTSAMGPLIFATGPSKLLSGFSAVTDEGLSHPNDADWLMWRRTYNGWGYSPLKQINKENVRHLETAWTWSLMPGVSETTPLVHDGVLFVNNSGDKVKHSTQRQAICFGSMPGS